MPRKARREVHAQLRDIFNAPDLPKAQKRARRLVAEYWGRFPELAEWLEETIEEPLGVFALPEGHRKRLRTTNGLERSHQELKRLSRVVRIFPDRAGCLHLATALAMEQSGEWLTGYRNLEMRVLEEPVETEEALEVVV